MIIGNPEIEGVQNIEGQKSLAEMVDPIVRVITMENCSNKIRLHSFFTLMALMRAEYISRRGHEIPSSNPGIQFLRAKPPVSLKRLVRTFQESGKVEPIEKAISCCRAWKDATLGLALAVLPGDASSDICQPLSGNPRVKSIIDFAKSNGYSNHADMLEMGCRLDYDIS